MESWVIGIFTALATAGTVILAILGAQWRLSTWLADRFTEFRNLIDDIKEELIKKIEYHERHDDKRFQTINDALWEIKVRNATKDNLMSELIRKYEGMTKTSGHQNNKT